jgi:anti-sigma B factor antagonist
MSVRLNIRQIGDVTVIDVSGRIALSEGSSGICDEVRSLTAGGNTKILLNLEEVPYIDSSGIGELVAGFTSAAKAGGKMKLLNPTGRVKDLLRMTNLGTVFEVHEDAAQAVRSFG